MIIKAIPDTTRFAREVAVLAHWNGDGSCRLIHADRASQVLLLSAVERAGGGPRPRDHQARVAGVLPSLHARPAPVHPDVPDLAWSFKQRIAPRLSGSPHLNRIGGPDGVQAVIRAGRSALDEAGPAVMLHADLYKENVLFAADGTPVCIDPRGRRGPAEYDWAFWTVLYDRGDFGVRLGRATNADGISEQALLAWVAVIAADSLHYYTLAGDQSAALEMLAVLLSAPVQSAIRRGT